MIVEYKPCFERLQVVILPWLDELLALRIPGRILWQLLKTDLNGLQVPGIVL